MRNQQGQITAVSDTALEGFQKIESENALLQTYLKNLSHPQANLYQSDLDFVRVLEDLIQLLINKNYILFTELPTKAQEKMTKRQGLRGEINNQLDLLSEDDDGILWTPLAME